MINNMATVYKKKALRSLYRCLAVILLLCIYSNSASAKDITNQYLRLKVNSENGRFVVSTTQGDPLIKTDDNKKLLFERFGEVTSYSTLKLDGKNVVFGNTNGSIIRQTSSQKRMEFAWGYEDLNITQTLTLVEGITTGREDSVRVEYVVYNSGSKSHTVGMRILLDTMLGSNDGTPFSVPGYGAVTTDTEFTGESVPTYWYAFDNIRTPAVCSLATVKIYEYKSPDRIVFSNWNRMYDSYWDVKLLKGRGFSPNALATPDSGVAVFWEPVKVDSYKSVKYAICYGLHKPAMNIGDAFNIAVSCPLKIYSAQQFTLVCDVENATDDGLLRNVIATMEVLPDKSLDLQKGSVKQMIDDLSAREAAKVNWLFQPSALYTGQVNIRITFSGELHSPEGVKQKSVVVEKDLMVIPQYATKTDSISTINEELLKANQDLAGLNLRLDRIDVDLKH